MCAIFSLVAGVSNDMLGRKKTIMLGSALFTLGSVVLAVSQTPWMLLIGRAIVGAAIGTFAFAFIV